MAELTEEELETIKAELEGQSVQDPPNVAEPTEFTGYGEVADNG